MVAIRIEINDDASGGLRRLQQMGVNLRPVMVDIGAMLRAATDLRFVDSTDPNGGKWKPLSPVTALLRKKGRGGQPLIDRSRLRTSITYLASSRDVLVGTNVKYAGTHQFGAKKGQYGKTKRNSPIPWGDVPARPFLGVSRDDEREMSDIIADHVRQALNGK